MYDDSSFILKVKAAEIVTSGLYLRIVCNNQVLTYDLQINMV